MAHFTQTRDCFYSPKTGEVGCPRAAHTSYTGSSFETDFHSYSRSHTYKHRIKCINSNTSAHMNFWAFTDSPNVQKYFHNSVPCFGTDQQPIPGIYSHQACILMQNFQHKDPNSPQIFWAVTAILEKSQKFPQVRSHVLGPIKRPLTASN